MTLPPDLYYGAPPELTLIHGDVLEALSEARNWIPDELVSCIATSPPFWRQRDYGDPAQLGQEDTPEQWAANLVTVFRAARRVLRPSGSLWVEIGDRHDGAKSLVGAPWLFAFAMKDAGWLLRQCVIWVKPNAQPESVTDRCSTEHSYLFHFTRRSRYYFDPNPIREPLRSNSYERTMNEGDATGQGSSNPNGRTMHAYGAPNPDGGNPRSVWEINHAYFPGAHFAVWPVELAARIVQCSCPPGMLVLDPFAGVGTTLIAARRHGRHAIGIELVEEHCDMAVGWLEHWWRDPSWPKPPAQEEALWE